MRPDDPNYNTLTKTVPAWVFAEMKAAANCKVRIKSDDGRSETLTFAATFAPGEVRENPFNWPVRTWRGMRL